MAETPVLVHGNSGGRLIFQMTLKEFVLKYIGKFVDFDKHYGNTCVDLYRQYCQEVLGVPQTPPVAGASDLWNTTKFQKIPNTILGVPQAGDIVIWGKGLNGYGHVGIFQSGNMFGFTSFDQNWPVGSPCHSQFHRYKYVLGWLRPAPRLPRLPLEVARIGVNLPHSGDFAAQVALYSSNKISVRTTDYGEGVVGKFTQDQAYKLVDYINPKEKFVFIFYQGAADSVFYATYYYPKRECVITTCPGTDPRSLAFEMAHAVQIMYNRYRGSNPFVEVEDSNFPDDAFIRRKYDSVSGYYNG